MKKVFNLSKFYKKALYDSGKGSWDRNSRAWPNCQKYKMEAENKSKQEAYQECLAEYNEMPHDEWSFKYNKCYADDGNCQINPPSWEKNKK